MDCFIAFDFTRSSREQEWTENYRLQMMNWTRDNKYFVYDTFREFMSMKEPDTTTMTNLFKYQVNDNCD